LCRQGGRESTQEALSLADGQPEFAEILFGELAELMARDAVLGECRDAVGETVRADVDFFIVGMEV